MCELTKIPAFGFLKENAVIGAKKVTHTEALSHNVRKTVGYLPGLSLIQGIEHLVRAIQNKKAYSPHFIFRSIVEMLGLGFLLLIPDIIVTCVRQHKPIAASLQPRKIVLLPTPTPQPVPTPVFPSNVEAFVKPPKQVDPQVHVIKKQFKKLIEQENVYKLEPYLDRINLDFTSQDIIDSLKKFMLKYAHLSDEAVYSLMRYLYINGALTESPEDVEFYKNLGITLAKAGKPASKLCAHLDLDLSKPHCLQAVIDIAKADAACNPADFPERYLNYNIKPTTEAHKIIVSTALQHNPAGMFALMKKEEWEFGIDNFTFKVEGTLEERKQKALKLVQHSIKLLQSNADYIKFDSKNEADGQALKEIILASFLKAPEETFKNAWPTHSTLWHDFALDLAKRSFTHTVQLIELLQLKPEDKNAKPLLHELGMSLLRTNPYQVYFTHEHVFGIEKKILDAEISKMAAEPTAVKKEILSRILETDPHNFVGSCNLLLTQSSEDLTLKKELFVRLIAINFNYVPYDHFDKETNKELVLKSAASMTRQEAYKLLTNLPSLCLWVTEKTDKEFYRSLGCILAKKEAMTLYYMKDMFEANDEKDFQTLRAMGLSLAAQDGSAFKAYAQYLGFSEDNKEHVTAFKEMLALAIADDGMTNLDAFGDLAPPQNKHILSMQQFCNLVSFFAGHKYINPLKYFEYVSPKEWDSLEGVAAREELIVRLMPKADEENTAELIVRLLEDLPDNKKAGLALAKYDPEAKFLFNLLVNNYKGIHEIFSEYAKHFGPAILGKLADDLKYLVEPLNEEELFLTYASIVRICPCLVNNFKGKPEHVNALHKLAVKPGSKEERLQAALQEASYFSPLIQHNLPFYHLDDTIPVLAKNFSVNPKHYLHTMPFTWPNARKIILKGAKKMSAWQLSLNIDEILEAHKNHSYGSDPNFGFELAKINAAKSAHLFYMHLLALSEAQIQEVVETAYFTDQEYTLQNLNSFAPKDKQAALKSYLSQKKVEGTLEERAKKAIKAIKHSPYIFSANLKHYFTEEELQNKKLPQPIIQAYLNACGEFHTFDYSFFKSQYSLTDFEQIEMLLLKAAQEAKNSFKLLNLEGFKENLNINPDEPQHRQLLCQLALIIANRYPDEVLTFVQQLKLDPVKPEERTVLCKILKQVSKVNQDTTHAVYSQLLHLYSDLDQSKEENLSFMSDFIIEVVKQNGMEQFELETNTWKKMKCLQQPLWKAFPPEKYKDVALY